MITSGATVWYVVHTRPREEQKALAHLRRQGYRAYLPMLDRNIRHARRTERVLRPFFPRYLFVSFDFAEQGWHSIRSTLGVADIVRFGDQPARLPLGLVEELKSHENDSGGITFASPPSIKSGDAVVVRDGPFSHLLGLCEFVAESERITVLFDLLGRKVRVLLDADIVEAA